MKYNLLIAALLYLVAEVFGFLAINTWRPLRKKITFHTDQRFLMWPHATAMLVATIFMGRGLVIFRITSGLRTRYVKWLHAAYFAVVSMIILFGLQYIQHGATLIPYLGSTMRKGEWKLSHTRLAYMVLPVYTIEMLMSAFVYLYMYPDQLVRRLYSAVHNFTSVIIFNWFIIMVICFFHESIPYSGKIEGNAEKIRNLSFYTMAFGAAIMACVINPALEFEITGPI